MRWLLIGLGWLALALVTTRLVGGAAKLGGPEDPRRGASKPCLICPKCGWTGDFGEAAFEIYVDDLEPYCPECSAILELGS